MRLCKASSAGEFQAPQCQSFSTVTDKQAADIVAYLRTLSGTGTSEKTIGDSQKGEALYNSSGCSTCHMIDGQGGSIGPDLSRIGASRGPTNLKARLQDPGANLPQVGGGIFGGSVTQYLMFRAVEKDGHDVEGMRVGEDSFTIVLKGCRRKISRTVEAQFALPGKRAGEKFYAELQGHLVRRADGRSGGLSHDSEECTMKTFLYALIFFVLLLPAAPRLFAQDVTYQQLLHADETPQNWLMYGGDYSSQRFSRLKQINRENVHDLKPAWIYQPDRPLRPVETSPIVVNGIMYVTEPLSTVIALDARLGTEIWSWSAKLPERIYTIGVHRSNRGVAILGNTLFMETLDAHLVALDATTGALKWNVHVDDNNQGYAMTGAPRALDGKVIIGVSGGDVGIRGFIDAYDAKTGKRLWRLWTIPASGRTWFGNVGQRYGRHRRRRHVGHRLV